MNPSDHVKLLKSEKGLTCKETHCGECKKLHTTECLIDQKEFDTGWDYKLGKWKE
jgi:hypothetical protein